MPASGAPLAGVARCALPSLLLRHSRRWLLSPPPPLRSTTWPCLRLRLRLRLRLWLRRRGLSLPLSLLLLRRLPFPLSLLPLRCLSLLL